MNSNTQRKRKSRAKAKHIRNCLNIRLRRNEERAQELPNNLRNFALGLLLESTTSVTVSTSLELGQLSSKLPSRFILIFASFSCLNSEDTRPTSLAYSTSSSIEHRGNSHPLPSRAWPPRLYQSIFNCWFHYLIPTNRWLLFRDRML